MHSSALKHYAESLKQMPTLPTVAIKLIEVAGKENVNLREIINLIEVDQALTSRVLLVSNSAQFGFSSKITTVDQAVSLLGLNLVRTISLSILIFRLFQNLQNGKNLNLVDLWSHNASCAIAAELLSRRFGYPQPQEAFAAGLMHDVGKMIFYHWNPSVYDQTLELARKEHIRLLEAEEKCFGIGHTDLAFHLMTHWRFPESLTHAAWLHHQPLSQFERSNGKQLPLIVKCANSVCAMNRFGSGGSPLPDLDLHHILHITGFTPRELESFSGEVLKRLEEVSQCFDFSGSTVEMYLSAVARANEELSELSVAMAVKNRSLQQQCQILESIRGIAEALPLPVNSGQALVKILELLSKTIPHRRLIGFIPRAEERNLEGYLRLSNGGAWERILFPFPADTASDPMLWNSREQISMVEKAVEQLGEKLTAAAEISSALHDGHLVVLPLSANGCNQGQILLELVDSNWSGREGIDLLRQYGRAAGLALQRVLLQEKYQSQAAALVRSMRQIDEVQLRLNHMERLSSVGRLAADAAHEINNPLTIISGRAQLMLANCSNEHDRKALQLIVDQTGRIAKIIRDLMGLAKPAEPKCELIQVEPILRQVFSLLTQRMKACGILAREEFQAGAPMVYADSKQLEQVFLNLSINAIHAMPRGGYLRFSVKHEEEKHRVRIEISDTGQGIPEKDLPSIFNPFYTTKKDGEGTGLGLTICQSIIQGHRGEIRVSSKIGEGTTFSIYLPVMAGLHAASVGALVHAAETVEPIVARDSKGYVLVIDDEDDLSAMMVEALVKRGYEAKSASDGVQGLEKLEQEHFDLLILDLKMPKKPGLEVLEALKETKPELPVIVISGVAHEDEFKEATKAGARICFKKPFNITQLLEAVGTQIRKR